MIIELAIICFLLWCLWPDDDVLLARLREREVEEEIYLIEEKGLSLTTAKPEPRAPRPSERRDEPPERLMSED